MDARVVGGRAAFLAAALFACNRSSETVALDPPAVPEHPSEDELEQGRPGPEREPAAPEPKAAEAPPPAVPTRVVLVTLDGVRWEDVFGATPATSTLAMPNLHRLVKDRGIAFGGAGCDHEVRASGPNFVSLPGYIEIFTGKPTTCTHNYCANVATDTIVDEARAANPGEVAVFASWNRYSAAAAKDRKSIVLSAGARTIKLAAAKDDEKLRDLLVAGAANAGYPGWGDYRADERTGKIALRYLETKTPRFLAIGLGDADEQAHRGDIAGYRKAIARSDEILGDLDRTLDRMGEAGAHTAVIVTTDHGRAKNLFNHGAQAPESARVFIAAFGAGIANRGVTCAPEELRLTHIAGAVRQLLDLEATGEPGPLAEAMLKPPLLAAVTPRAESETRSAR